MLYNAYFYWFTYIIYNIDSRYQREYYHINNSRFPTFADIPWSFSIFPTSSDFHGFPTEFAQRACKCILEIHAKNISVREWIRQWDAHTGAHNSRLYDTLMNALAFFALLFALWRSTWYYLFCCRYSDIYHRFHGMRRRATREHMPPRRGKLSLWDSITFTLNYFNCPISFETSNFDRASGSLRDIYELSVAVSHDWTKVRPLRNATFKST